MPGIKKRPRHPKSCPSSIESTPEASKASQPVVKVQESTTEASPSPQEQHFTIYYGDTGYSYDSIFGPYLQGAKNVQIEEPYVRANHQINNFVRFCETVAKAGTVKRIELTIGFDEDTSISEIQEKLKDLKQSLLELDIILEIQLNENLHDREIRLDNGWTIKIGRGLDFYQKPESWFGIGVNDMSLRKCLETKVDIYRAVTA